ncbi:MAG: hypothetical protein JRM82_03035, partial [Nitrososphaerota archaeon]|nr:hypothetical protein [Nitrososphaerota archaeon]
FDFNYLLSRTFRKSVAEDARRVKERLAVVRNLLLKYNPALRREGLESEEEKTFAISLKDLLSGGVWWGKRFVKWGLKDRYLHLLSLAKELPEGPVRDEVFASLSLFSEVATKLDEGLKGLEPSSR